MDRVLSLECVTVFVVRRRDDAKTEVVQMPVDQKTRLRREEDKEGERLGMWGLAAPLPLPTPWEGTDTFAGPIMDRKGASCSNWQEPGVDLST